LQMAQLMLANIKIKQDILEDNKYRFLFSVESVNQLVLSGVPFRDAYKKVGQEIEAGTYQPSSILTHTHEGSIGNLCLPELKSNMDAVISSFKFADYRAAISKLVK
jgi:argininosuccinate lyase